MYENFNRQRLQNTMDIFEEYENRFGKAKLSHPHRRPWEEKDREEIRKQVYKCLKFSESLIPEIKILQEETGEIDGIKVKHMLFESWENFHGISSLFVPENSENEPRPLIILCPGHGALGRLTPSYQRLARHFAKQGAYSLLLENIGQGCRQKQGHWDAVEIFSCNLTLQGLIIAESRAWINYFKDKPYIDKSRIGACGNSGGGTITQFLAATEPSLSAVASCGYPNDYAYIFQKERPHCCCNLLPGIMGNLEMWETYSLFAPKPLLLECGEYDNLLPVDYFHTTARKTANVYSQMGKGENFRAEITDEKHPWAEGDLIVISDFFAKHFKLSQTELSDIEPQIMHSDISMTIPENSLTAAELAQKISGITVPENAQLWDACMPVYNGKPIDKATIVPDLGRGDLMRVFTQYEMTLKGFDEK